MRGRARRNPNLQIQEEEEVAYLAAAAGNHRRRREESEEPRSRRGGAMLGAWGGAAAAGGERAAWGVERGCGVHSRARVWADGGREMRKTAVCLHLKSDGCQ